MILHPASWVIWLAAALIPLSTTRNPIYLAAIMAMLATVYHVIPAATPLRTPISPWRFALIVIPVAAFFNALLVHYGQTVLFSLPQAIPFFGGDITLEALVFGALNGVVLSGILTAFTIINQVLPVRALLWLTPQVFYPVAVIVSIALTFTPTLWQQLQQIKEAQAIRGHQMRGLRDWLPLFIPLLVGGLERAMQLAETMTARGFAGNSRQKEPLFTRVALIIGLLLLLSGWLLSAVWGYDWPGGLLALTGVLAIGAVLWSIGRRNPRTRYRPQPWQLVDWWVTGAALLTITIFIAPFPEAIRETRFYYPYPQLSWPQFHPVYLFAAFGLLTPVLLRRKTLLPARAQV